MTNNLDVTIKIQDLYNYEEKFINVSKELIKIGDKTYEVDYLVIGVINRSLSLISGFLTLLQNSNYIAAAHLVRLHLDNYLRLYALWLCENPNQFVKEVFSGTPIKRLKSKEGKNLRDDYLVSKAKEKYPWIENVYLVTSGFIHFSSKHIFTSIKVKDAQKGEIEFRIGKEDKYVPDEARVEAIDAMIEVSNCIIHLIESWIYTKNMNFSELHFKAK